MQNAKELIAKLYAKAMDPALSLEEANAFMDKVQELLVRHELSEEDLRTGALEIDEEPYRMTSWNDKLSKLAVATASLYFSDVYRDKRPNKERPRLTEKGIVFGEDTYFVFIGKKHYRKVAVSMFDYFLRTIERLSKEYTSDRKDQAEFVKGAAIRLVERIYEKMKADQAAPVAVKGTTLPAIYRTESTELALYKEKNDLDNAAKKSARTKVSDAAVQGFMTANGIGLDTQVAGTPKAHSYLKQGDRKWVTYNQV